MGLYRVQRKETLQGLTSAYPEVKTVQHMQRFGRLVMAVGRDGQDGKAVPERPPLNSTNNSRTAYQKRKNIFRAKYQKSQNHCSPTFQKRKNDSRKKYRFSVRNFKTGRTIFRKKCQNRKNDFQKGISKK